MNNLITEDFDVNIPLNHTNRIHRVGEHRLNIFSKKYEHEIIIKFKDWEDRCLVYQSRPSWIKIKSDRSIKKPSRRFSIKLDLPYKRNKLF